jgi:Spy/CpxP family protein refolding chaperone
VNRARLISTGLLIGAFVLGGVAGAFAMRTCQQERLAHELAGSPGHARMRFRMDALARQLGLNEDQRDRIWKIIESHEDERRKLLQKCDPDFRALREKIDGEIRAVLTPDQRVRFGELEKTIAQRRRHWRHH